MRGTSGNLKIKSRKSRFYVMTSLFQHSDPKLGDHAQRVCSENSPLLFPLITIPAISPSEPCPRDIRSKTGFHRVGCPNERDDSFKV